jgi:hypothetical protein
MGEGPAVPSSYAPGQAAVATPLPGGVRPGFQPGAPLQADPAPVQAGHSAQDPREPLPTPATLPLQRPPSRRRVRWIALAGAAFTVAALLGVGTALQLAQPDPSAPSTSTSESPAGLAPEVTGGPSSEPSPTGASSTAPAPTGSSEGDRAAPTPDSRADRGPPLPEPSKSTAGPKASSTPATTSPPAPPRPPPPPAAPFDPAAAASALARAAAAASACSAPGAPTGTGMARVLFGGDGHTLSVVLEGPFGNSPIQGCILGAFRSARVPPFAGATASAVKSFTIR